MCLGLASGFMASANVVPDNMEWNTGLEAYIEKQKVKVSAKLEEYNLKGNRMSKNTQQDIPKVPKYTEIFKLKRMLEDAEIPFVFADESYDLDDGFKFEKYHIEYPCSYKENQDLVCSVIQGWGTYGAEQDLLEIMGLLTDEEKEDCVCGWLTAEDVFERIKTHYEGSKVLNG